MQAHFVTLKADAERAVCLTMPWKKCTTIALHMHCESHASCQACKAIGQRVLLKSGHLHIIAVCGFPCYMNLLVNSPHCLRFWGSTAALSSAPHLACSNPQLSTSRCSSCWSVMLALAPALLLPSKLHQTLIAWTAVLPALIVQLTCPANSVLQA